MSETRNYLQTTRNPILSVIPVFAAVWLYFLSLSWFTLGKHTAFRTSAWDLGIYNQALYNTIFSGRFLYYTPELFANPTGYLFVTHFSPVMLLILPVYYLSPSPEILLIIQSAVLGLAAVPLHAFALHMTLNRTIATSIAILYLVNPLTHSVNWYDFHPEAFLPLFIFAAYYFRAKQKWKQYIASLILVASVIEQAAIVVAFIAASHLIPSLWSGSPHRQRVLIIREVLLIAFAATWLFVALWYMYSFPHSRGPTAYFSAVSSSLYHLPFDLLADPTNLVRGLAFEARYKLAYWLLSFASVGFLSFSYAISLLPIVPWAAVSLLSNYRPFYSLGYQYPAFALPFLFISATYGAQKLLQSASSRRTRICSILCVAFAIALITTLAASPLSPRWAKSSEVTVSNLFFDYGLPRTDELDRLRTLLISRLQRSSSVLSTARNFPRLSNRPNAYAIRPYTELLFESEDAFRGYLSGLLAYRPEYVMLDFRDDPFASRQLAFLLSDRPWSSRYSIVSIYKSTLVLYKRDYAGPALTLATGQPGWDLQAFLPSLEVRSGKVVFKKVDNGWSLDGRVWVQTTETNRLLFHPAPPIGSTEIQYLFKSLDFTKLSFSYALIIPPKATSDGVRLMLALEPVGGNRRILLDRYIPPHTAPTTVEIKLNRSLNRPTKLILTADGLKNITFDWLTVTLTLE